MMLVAHTLRTFGLHMGDEVRLAPSRPLHVHTSMVSEENVAFVNEPSTVRPEGMLDQVPSLVKQDSSGGEPGEDDPDDDQVEVVREELSMFTTTLDMAKQAGGLPKNAAGWLPEPGAYDIVVVGVQNCEYVVPERDNAWMAMARRTLVQRMQGGRCHFDFLACLVSHLGPQYKLVADASCDKSRLAVFVLKEAAASLSEIKSASSVFTTSASAAVAGMGIAGARRSKSSAVAISLQVHSTPLLIVNLRLPPLDKAACGAAARDAVAQRNRIVANLLQQLQEVQQVPGADLLEQFPTAVVLGNLGYGSVGSTATVTHQLLQVRGWI
jgi:hypothetical protein